VLLLREIRPDQPLPPPPSPFFSPSCHRGRRERSDCQPPPFPLAFSRHQSRTPPRRGISLFPSEGRILSLRCLHKPLILLFFPLREEGISCAVLFSSPLSAWYERRLKEASSFFIGQNLVKTGLIFVSFPFPPLERKARQVISFLFSLFFSLFFPSAT